MVRSTLSLSLVYPAPLPVLVSLGCERPVPEDLLPLVPFAFLPPRLDLQLYLGWSHDAGKFG